MSKREIIDLDSGSENENEIKRPHREVIDLSSDEEEEPLVVPKPVKTPAEIKRDLMAGALERRIANPNLVKERIDEASEASIKAAHEPKMNEGCQLKSRIRLFTNPEYCNLYHNGEGDKDTISMKDLLGSPYLESTFQFNFLIDMAFVTQFVTTKSVKFTVINQSQSDYLHVPDSLWEKYQIHSIDASKNLKKYGSHHTKMMINFFTDSTCQIVIHSMNLTAADYSLQTQMAWVSPKLKKDIKKKSDIKKESFDIHKDTGVLFKRDLLTYLCKYQEPEINELMNRLSEFDFDLIDVVFVGSAPGDYKYHDKEVLKDPSSPPCFGYGRLWQIIQQHNLESLDGTFVSQMSSISGPFDGFQRNIFVHLLTSCVENGYPFAKNSNYEFKRGQRKVEPVIIWPTVREILSNYGGAQSGRALFYTNDGKWAGYKRQALVLKNYLYKWCNNNTESKAKRSNLSPHVKSYTLSEDNFKTLKWFLLTSANLSHHAWGKPAKFDPNNKSLLHYGIGSYEAGVLIVPDKLRVNNPEKNKKVVLVPTFGEDSISNESTAISEDTLRVAIRMPYDIPLTKYSSDDHPWARPGAESYILACQ